MNRCIILPIRMRTRYLHTNENGFNGINLHSIRYFYWPHFRNDRRHVERQIIDDDDDDYNHLILFSGFCGCLKQNEGKTNDEQ